MYAVELRPRVFIYQVLKRKKHRTGQFDKLSSEGCTRTHVLVILDIQKANSEIEDDRQYYI